MSFLGVICCDRAATATQMRILYLDTRTRSDHYYNLNKHDLSAPCAVRLRVVVAFVCAPCAMRFAVARDAGWSCRRLPDVCGLGRVHALTLLFMNFKNAMSAPCECANAMRIQAHMSTMSPLTAARLPTWRHEPICVCTLPTQQRKIIIHKKRKCTTARASAPRH